ncbi:hypothetical protein DCAR_0312929 [Daucus carota subsp. sativus]|uniref:Uncharacterized protein n=1 Tax=Daucus carota subsp. sativus TaxID=79200 RepID=A0A161WVF9_DAUCS|nr:hypothetical protein DCAR_0312929 [Daucus carota subsp. sativus]
MEPEPTMKLNDEKIVNEQLEEPCDMETENVVNSATLLPVSAPSRVESTDSPLVLSSLPTEPQKVSGSDTGEHDSGLKILSEGGPCTPKDALFDPLASGPDKLLAAPFWKRCRSSACILSSSLKCMETELSEGDATRKSENGMVDAVDEDSLGAMMSNQVKGISVSDDGRVTPTSVNPLSDVAETCPDAPERNGGNSKKTSKKKLIFGTAGLCRRLDF